MTFSVTSVFEESESLTLTGGLMIYGDGKEASLITAHDVIKPISPGETPRLGPGSLIKRDALVKMFKGLDTIPQERFVLPANVVCWESNMLCWWKPAGRRRIFFSANNDVINKLSGEEVLHPPLLFRAQYNLLSVWALDKDERPTGSTSVCRAPYFNIYDSGAMCTGNIRLPEYPSPNAIDKWEECFFGSNFSSANIQSIVNHPEGHTGYWVGLSKPTATKRYAMKYLYPLPLTLSKIVQGHTK